MQLNPYTNYDINLESFTPNQQVLIEYARDRLLPIYGEHVETILRDNPPHPEDTYDIAWDHLYPDDTSTGSLTYKVAQELKRFGVDKYLRGYDIQNEEAITLAEIIRAECHPKANYITFNPENTLVFYAQAYIRWVHNNLGAELTELISEAIDEAT